jgi:hypothetical protein
MGTTQARLFRLALAELGDPDINPRVLNEVYSEAVHYCLQQGYWNFSLATATLATGGTRLFGYSKSSVKPTDYVRTVRISDVSSFWPPLENWEDARGYIHSTSSPLYMVYVSNATDAGFSLSEWPQTFALYVAGELARRVAKRTKIADLNYEALEARVRGYLVNALIKDSFDGGTLAREEDLTFRARIGAVMPGIFKQDDN